MYKIEVAYLALSLRPTSSHNEVRVRSRLVHAFGFHRRCVRILLLAGIQLHKHLPISIRRVVERALPPGHPVIGNEALPDTNYTVRADIWPSGFAAPTVPITAYVHLSQLGKPLNSPRY